jgi:integrase/recombinase XerD
MARVRRPRRRPHPVAGDLTDLRSMAALLERFLSWMRQKNYSERTVADREQHLLSFIAWCDERGVSRATEVTRAVLEGYQRYLYHYRRADGQPLSFRGQHIRLAPVRAFFKYLARSHLILFNPASELELPKLGHRLPRHVLSAKEAERVLVQPDVDDPLGVRDRAILEVLYSTGIRRCELIRLRLYDLDPDRGVLVVRQGKGRRDRVIPIGDRAVAWTERYIAEVRPTLVMPPDDGVLFLTHLGQPFSANRMTQLVRKHVDAAELGKTGSCHLFRHTMATLMLEGGADIRFIQQMLGHVDISTTQIYTQVSIRKLKAIHTATHPARLDGPHIEPDADEPDADEPEKP